jgi:hypothetical protein
VDTCTWNLPFFVFQIVGMPQATGATTDIVMLMARANTYHILKTPDEELLKPWQWCLLRLQTKSG